MASSKASNKKTDAKIDPMAALNPMAVTVWQDIMKESVRFMTERLQKDMETQQALLNCKSPTELLQLQADFYQDAMADYTAEATKMLELMSKGSGMASRSYDDVPL